MKALFATAVTVILCLLSGCSTLQPAAVDDEATSLDLHTSLFGERPDIVTVSQIHSLTEEQQRAVFSYFLDPKRLATPAHKRVYDYLALETSRFNYRGDTYVAAEALETLSGNCLSLAILTTSLAQLADVDIDYQLMDSDPVFQSAGNIIRRSRHVRSVLIAPTWKSPEGNAAFLSFGRPSIKVDYFPSETDRMIGHVRDSEYTAMYYQNVAADALEDNDLSQAYWLLMESLKFSPLSPESLNMLAIVFDRADDPRKSEEIYLYGIEHATRQVSLLRNYGKFLERGGRFTEAEQINARLAQLDDPNPFDWIFAGQEAYGNGDYTEAIEWFEKSAALAPYLHESYFGLARTYFRLGEFAQAEYALEQAIEHAARSSTRQLYEAKLAALNAGNTG